MKRKNHLVQMLIAASMSVMLCGCPGIQDDQGPVGYIVKMDTDYSHNVIAEKLAEHSYMVKCGNGHTIPLSNNYYLITENYASSVYTIWDVNECNDSIRNLCEIDEYVLNDDPYSEVYTLNEEESIKDLIKRTDSKNFKGLTKEK